MLNVVERSSFDKKLYTGLCDLNIVAFNPDATMIAELTGREDVKEPEYGGFDRDGNAQRRLDVWYANNQYNILFKESIWLVNKRMLSGAGNTQWIDKVGVSGWAAEDETGNPVLSGEPKKDYFKRNSPRKAYGGEVDLYNLLCAWANLDQKAEEVLEKGFVLDTPFEDIISGDLTELNDIVELYAKRQVKRLLGVREGKYQTIYPKVCTAGGNTWIKGYENELARDITSGYPWKADHQNSLKFQEYTGESAPVASITTNVASLLDQLK